MWAAEYGFAGSIGLAAGVFLAVSGAAQVVFSICRYPSLWTGVELYPVVLLCLRRRKLALGAIPGAAVGGVCFLGALKFLDPTAAHSLTQITPIVYAVWLCRSAARRFQLGHRALTGLVAGCSGAVMVVWASAAAEQSTGWGVVVGVLLVSASVAAVSVESQELALVSDVGDKLGWGGGAADQRRESSLAIPAAGSRDVMAGIPLIAISAFVAGNMPGRVWFGVVVFAAVLAPAAVAMFRSAVMMNGDMGLTAVHSAGGLATLAWTGLVGVSPASNVGLLIIGTAAILIGAVISMAEAQLVGQTS